MSAPPSSGTCSRARGTTSFGSARPFPALHISARLERSLSKLTADNGDTATRRVIRSVGACLWTNRGLHAGRSPCPPQSSSLLWKRRGQRLRRLVSSLEQLDAPRTGLPTAQAATLKILESGASTPMPGGQIPGAAAHRSAIQSVERSFDCASLPARTMLSTSS